MIRFEVSNGGGAAASQEQVLVMFVGGDIYWLTRWTFHVSVSLTCVRWIVFHYFKLPFSPEGLNVRLSDEIST